MTERGVSRATDPHRLAAVAATGLLDTGPEPAFDDLASLAATLLAAPFAFVTLVDERRSFWKSRIGIDPAGPVQNTADESFCQYVIASGRPLIAGDVTAHPLTAANPSIDSMGVRAWAGFPLVSPEGFTLGSFCVVDTVTRTWSERDVETLRVLSAAAAREIALRATVDRAEAARAGQQSATAQLEQSNARLRVALNHDRVVSRQLQAAMLTRLPEPDHLHLVARYRTADFHDQVGGDWYDAVLTRDGATTLMIGDVAGHDIAAATVMGQLRNMLRMLAWEHGDPPSNLITRLDRAMAGLDVTTMTTLVVARIEQGDADAEAGLRTLRWSCAGHPVPVLIDAGGHARLLTARPDPPLATVRPDIRHDHVVTIGPGQTLLMYTDGLVENRTDDLDVRQQQLLDVLAGHGGTDLDLLLDTVVSEMVGDTPDDDVALIAVRFNPER